MKKILFLYFYFSVNCLFGQNLWVFVDKIPHEVALKSSIKKLSENTNLSLQWQEMPHQKLSEVMNFVENQDFGDKDVILVFFYGNTSQNEAQEVYKKLKNQKNRLKMLLIDTGGAAQNPLISENNEALPLQRSLFLYAEGSLMLASWQKNQQNYDLSKHFLRAVQDNRIAFIPQENWKILVEKLHKSFPKMEFRLDMIQSTNWQTLQMRGNK